MAIRLVEPQLNDQTQWITAQATVTVRFAQPSSVQDRSRIAEKVESRHSDSPVSTDDRTEDSADQLGPEPAQPETSPMPGVILMQLAEALASLYFDSGRAGMMAALAGLDLAQITFDAKAINTWDSILTEAERQGRTQTLLDRADVEYPVHDELTAAREAYVAWVNAGRPSSTTAPETGMGQGNRTLAR